MSFIFHSMNDTLVRDVVDVVLLYVGVKSFLYSCVLVGVEV